MASIGVDATFVRPGVTGGAQQMLENLLDALVEVVDPGDALVVFGAATRRPTGSDERLRWVEPPRARNRFVQSWRIYRGLAGGLDALLFPNYFTPPRRRTSAPRVVTVVHDLQYLVYPENFSSQKRVFLRVAHELTLRSADVVVAVSEHVRQDVLERYGSRWEQKVITIPNPISWRRFDAEEGTNAVDDSLRGRRYVLSVSAQYPHKNLGTLLRAFAGLRSRDGFGDVVLVLAGQWSDRLVGIARRVNLNDDVRRLGIEGAVRLTGYLRDAEIGDLYRGATVFAFPSLFEGFGMPAVEALGFGLPVLSSRRAALPETTLGLATYLDDPLDVAAMSEALAAMLESPDAFRPGDADILRIRESYSPSRVGEMYLRALIGRS